MSKIYIVCNDDISNEDVDLDSYDLTCYDHYEKELYCVLTKGEECNYGSPSKKSVKYGKKYESIIKNNIKKGNYKNKQVGFTISACTTNDDYRCRDIGEIDFHFNEKIVNNVQCLIKYNIESDCYYGKYVEFDGSTYFNLNIEYDEDDNQGYTYANSDFYLITMKIKEISDSSDEED